jgi:arabinose-5-phosphate isomerase
LEYLGRLANAFGAAGVQSVGGVPVDSSKELLQHYLPDITFGVQTAADDGLTEFAGSLGRDATAASQVASSLNFTRWHGVLELLTNCTGQIYTSGIGKSGIIASRLASSLSSIGVPSHYVNACEWCHGELGKLIPHKDVCIFLSHGGHTNETLTAAQMIKDKGITTIAITGTSGNPLGEVCQYGLDYSNVPVKEPFDCLPTTSLIVQEMLCNAVICELINMKNVSTQTFTSNHPGGSIGLFHNNN